jgi:hypothetical protein
MWDGEGRIVAGVVKWSGGIWNGEWGGAVSVFRVLRVVTGSSFGSVSSGEERSGGGVDPW